MVPSVGNEKKQLFFWKNAWRIVFFYGVVNTYAKNEKKLLRGSQNVAAKVLTVQHDKIGIWARVTAVSAHIPMGPMVDCEYEKIKLMCFEVSRGR